MKYNNQRTTGLKCNIFQKGKRLYGIDTALKSTPPLYIFEGQADVITAKHHGLLNCVGVAGSSVSGDHVHLLKKLGQYDILICLDGDEVGRKKIAPMLEKFAGHRDVRLRVIELPENEDPDSFIRKQGIEAFKKLAQWSAFEWQLNQFKEDVDPTQLCAQMIPVIVNEPSAVNREAQCKVLAGRTGVALKAIKEDLAAILDAKAKQRSVERQTVLDKAVYVLQKYPGEAEQILVATRTELKELSKKYDSDSLSSENFILFIDQQKVEEEKIEAGSGGQNYDIILAPL